MKYHKCKVVSPPSLSLSLSLTHTHTHTRTHTHTQCHSVVRPLIKIFHIFSMITVKSTKYKRNISYCTHKAPCTVSGHRTAYRNSRTNSLHKPPPRTCIEDRTTVNRNMMADRAKITQALQDMALCPLENSVSAECAVCIFRIKESKKVQRT